MKSLDCEYISAILTMDAGLIGSIRCGRARAGLSTHLHAHIRGCAESHPTSRSHLLHAADRRDTRFTPARLVQDRHTVQRSPAPWPLDELHHICPRLRERNASEYDEIEYAWLPVKVAVLIACIKTSSSRLLSGLNRVGIR